MDIRVRILSSDEIGQAIDCFVRAISRDWPNTEDEARSWVDDEFHNPNSTIFGAVVDKRLVGVCSLIPFDFILQRLSWREAKLLTGALKKKFRESESETKVIYIGGFGVDKRYEGKGIGGKLLLFAEKTALNRGYRALVAQTARPSKKYKIKGLAFALLVMQMSELSLAEKIFLPSPRDLEKVWLYKFLK